MTPAAGGYRPVDDWFESRRFPNAGLARAWAKRRAEAIPREHPGAMLSDAKVTVERWDADDFEDFEYGTILDAVAVSETEQYGTIADDGSIDWDEPEPVRAW